MVDSGGTATYGINYYNLGKLAAEMCIRDRYSIPGTPPNLFADVKGDAFAPRNPYALKIDFVESICKGAEGCR